MTTETSPTTFNGYAFSVGWRDWREKVYRDGRIGGGEEGETAKRKGRMGGQVERKRERGRMRGREGPPGGTPRGIPPGGIPLTPPWPPQGILGNHGGVPAFAELSVAMDCASG